jgi:hypothetical protein
MLSLWRSIATEASLPSPAPLVKYDYPPEHVNSRSLVLLNWTQNFFRVDLDDLLKTGAHVVAYLEKGRTLNPNAVIHNVSKQLRDCCSEGSFKEELFRERLDCILEGNSPYAPFNLTFPMGGACPRPQSAFLATPRDEELYRPFYKGAVAALNTVGIQILNPAEERGTDEIKERVLRRIDECDLVIANLRLKKTDEERGYNPNVWYEIGYAWRANKPVLLFRHVSDWLKRPSDVQASDFQSYCDAIDLALQLFYGFGGHATSHVP